MGDLDFVWLEITGKCQLECVHCMAESGPQGTDGSMRMDDWARVIGQAAELGTRMVQFIGGEPTLHPGLPDLIDHALGRGLEVEVFSNLAHVSERMWSVFEQPKVRLAASYYSSSAEQHEAITKGRDSYRRTRENIAEALRRSIPIRTGVIGVNPGQNVSGAVADLIDLGVTEEIRADHLRQVGRGVRDLQPDVDQLCGGDVCDAQGEFRCPAHDGEEGSSTVRSAVRPQLRTGVSSAVLADGLRAVQPEGRLPAQLRLGAGERVRPPRVRPGSAASSELPALAVLSTRGCRGGRARAEVRAVGDLPGR
ncbi:radical SAM protein [Amycolatopsis sp. NPDC059021]|uniref:radical SAM protein n=1 Tax=Amycolatopsis sp. NPDC059021 TaxID=3346704 RepID=UPI00367065EF